MALLGLGELGVERLEPRLGVGRAFAELLELRVQLLQFLVELGAPAAGRLRLLRLLQPFDLALVGAGLRLGGLAACRELARRRLGVGGLGTHQRAVGLLGDQALRPQLALEVLDLLGPRQKSGLFRVGGIKAHRVAADRMTLAGHDDFAVGEPLAVGQRRVQARRGVHPFEPIAQQRGQAGVVQAQPLAEQRQGCRATGCRDRVRAVKRQLGRWHVGSKRAHRVQAADLQGPHALAQRRLERSLPARLDVQPRPQALQVLQTVLGQPRFERALGLHLGLQRPQRLQPGTEVGAPPAFGVGAVLLRAARRVQGRDLLVEHMQCGVADVLRVLGLRQRLLQLGQALRLRGGQLGELGAQLVASELELAALLVHAAALGGQNLDVLLHRADLGALLAGMRLRQTQRLLQFGHRLGAVVRLRRQDIGLLLGSLDLHAHLRQLGLRLRAALAPLFTLRAPLDEALLKPGAAVDNVADALLQAAHLQRRLCQAALGRVQRIVGREMRLAQRLQPRLAVAQLRSALLQRVHGRLHRELDPGLLAGRIAVLQEPQLVQLEVALRLQRPVPGRHLGLALQLVKIAVEFAQDVLNPRQVLARVLQAALGLAAALLVLGHPRGLLQKQPQFLGLALDDPADRALADDRVGARAQARAEKHVLDVAPAHRLAVDVVAARAVAGQHPLDRDLAVAVPLAAGAAVFVAEHQLDAGARGRADAGRPGGPVRCRWRCWRPSTQDGSPVGRRRRAAPRSRRYRRLSRSTASSSRSSGVVSEIRKNPSPLGP